MFLWQIVSKKQWIIVDWFTKCHYRVVLTIKMKAFCWEIWQNVVTLHCQNNKVYPNERV